MNIKIGRKLALMDVMLKNYNIEKSKNVFSISTVTDVAVSIKNVYNHMTYTISLPQFESSLKTFLTDEIIAKRNKKKESITTFEIKENKVKDETKETKETKEEEVIIEEPKIEIIVPSPLGKLVFRYLKITPIVQLNQTYDDPYSDLYN
jgi:hypothetical protein